MMKTEEEIRARLKEMKEKLTDTETGELMDDAHWGEGEQAEAFTLSWVLGEQEGW